MRFLLTKLSHFFIFFLGLSVTAPNAKMKKITNAAMLTRLFWLKVNYLTDFSSNWEANLL